VAQKPRTKKNPREFIEQNYKNGVFDEFLIPTAFNNYSGAENGDGFIFINFRNDRMREFVQALGDKKFDKFPTKDLECNIITMTEYDASFARMQEKFAKGELDHLKIKVTMPNNPQMPEEGLPPQMIQVQESIVKVLGGMGKKGPEKEVTVKEAKSILAQEASETLLDEEQLH
jgi:ATP-dependent protease HslVU (ClpYQ) ATPase subunit